MPHFGTHLVTLDQTIAKLISIDPAYTDFFAKEKNLLMARWGAIGPDIFFFSFYEGDEGAALAENSIFLGYQIMEPIRKIKEILEPIEDDEEEMKKFLTGHLYGQFRDRLEELKGLIATFIIGEIGKGNDFLTWFELKLAQGKDESKWYWFDMLHYRYTGEFAKNLMFLANEETDDEMRESLIAYTIGYLTHLSTDIVGHPYVNRSSGGPYRTQWHRHFLCENVIDTWAWLHYNPDIGEPEDDVEDNSLAFASIHASLELEPDEKKRLASLIHEAIGRTYNSVNHPEIINQDQIRSLFDFMYEYIEHATTQSILSVPTPPPPEVVPAIGDLFEEPPVIPNPADEDVNWEDVFAGMIAFVSWTIETLIEVATLPFAVSTDLATFPLRWWLYQIQLLLYYLQKEARKILVYEGYLIPHNDEINDAFLTDFTHQKAYSQEYPRRRNAPVLYDAYGQPRRVEPPEDPPPSNLHQCDYPETGVERPTTISSSYEKDDTPQVFIDSVVEDLSRICPKLREFAKSIGPYSPARPEPGKFYTDQASKDVLSAGNHHPFGAAPDLGAIFIQKALLDQKLFDLLGLTESNATKLSALQDLDMGSMDFNLDSDRGFGWKCWRANIDFDTNDRNEVLWGPNKVVVDKYLSEEV